MKKNIYVDYVKQKYPQSTSLYSLLFLGVAFLIAPGTINIFSPNINTLLAKILQCVGIAFFVIFLVAVVLETIAKIFPLTLVILRYLVIFLTFIGNIYFVIIKLIIRSSVLTILEEKETSKPEDIIFYAEDGRWTLADKPIKADSIKNLEFVVRPSQESTHWRFGFKFSGDGIFSITAYDRNLPLLHLTKDLGVNKLKLDYYDEFIQHHQEVLLDKYNNEKITVKICLDKKNKNNVRISVYDENSTQIFGNGFLLKYYKYLIPAAWGDGRKYELNVRQYLNLK
jgi:hypothetical protein